MFAGLVGDSVGYAAAEDLSEAVEAEPDTCSEALFFLGIPLLLVRIFMATMSEVAVPVK